MGLMARRERRVASAAATHVAEGETVQAVAMVQTDGIPPEGADRRRRAAAKKFTVHAVVATDAAVYLFAVSALATIERTVIRIPLPDAEVAVDRGRMRVGSREFHVLPFGGAGAHALVQRVDDARAAE